VLGRSTTQFALWAAPADRDRFLQELRANGAVRNLEYRFRRASGEIRHGLLSSRPIEVDGRALIVTSVVDITERKRAEEELERSRGLLNTILDSIQDDFYVLDRSWTFIHASRQFSGRVGRRPEDFVGRCIWELFPKHLGTELEENFRAAMERGETRRFEVTGRYTDACYRLTAFPSAEGITVLGTDVTEQKRTEATLRESEARVKRLIETAHEGVWMLDMNAVTTYVNPRMAEMLGRTPEEMIGRSAFDFVWPADIAVGLAEWEQRRADAGGRQTEFRYSHKDGHPVWCEVKVSPVLDAEGRQTGTLGMFTDATDRKLAEDALRQANAELAEADQRKNQFLAVLSHELRNPLSPILSSVYVLRHAAPGGEQATRALDVIERQARHEARLVDDLLEVTRITRGKIRLERDTLDLAGLAARSAEDYRHKFAQAGVALEVDIARTSLWVDGDPARLAQVVGNLLSNAAKFTDRGGRVRLSLAPQGEEAVISVRDTGVGIAPDFLAVMFEPFTQSDHTLDRTRGGLGLGLAVLKGLVALHGGSVEAHSDGPGMGAEFQVRLPLVARPSAPAGSSAPVAAGGRRVLVIEDNPDAAQSLKDLLELRGHTVEIAGNGALGLEAARTSRPDVVLCDIGLPGLNGFEVGRALRADPQLAGTRLIGLSGYAQPEDIAKAKAAGFDLHLKKPVDPDDLADI
jgi:PAS domain S-box-containing protein